MNWQVLHEEIDVSSLVQMKKAMTGLLPLFGKKQILLFEGEMGAGKTQAIRFLCELLGMQEEVASPTFAIHHHYKGKIRDLDHVDLYRLTNEDELESSGFWDLLSSQEGLIAIEWASRVKEAHWSPSWRYLKIEIKKQNNVRSLKISKA